MVDEDTTVGSAAIEPDSLSRPNKRPRVDEPKTEETPTTTDDEFFCFDDANIVLISKQAIGFRVHRGILALHCEFFADMFNLAHFLEVDEKGTEELQVTDQSEDLRHFLHYMYTPGYLSTISAFPSRQLGGMLRLATKYLCSKLRDEIVAHLRKVYPQTYTAFRLSFDSYMSGKSRDANALRAILLARECNVPEILPAAFYTVSLIDVERLETMSPKLSKEDKKRVATGRSKLTNLAFGEAWSWMRRNEFAGECKSSRSCRNARVFAIQRLLGAAGSAIALFTKPLPSAELKPGTDSKVCPQCHEDWDENEVEGYEDVWEELPKCFELDPWLPVPSQ